MLVSPCPVREEQKGGIGMYFPVGFPNFSDAYPKTLPMAYDHDFLSVPLLTCLLFFSLNGRVCVRFESGTVSVFKIPSLQVIICSYCKQSCI